MYQPQLHQHGIDQRRHLLESRAARYRRAHPAVVASTTTKRGSASC